ncbi:hypothetical protein ACHAW5_009531 [Stephanodiscus triporus]|uniref:SURF1-like protein n=1 Tax=Stephanodiscus triporus TaxID=2934178 RepID=A0ABD3NIZ9_9STRA
MIPSTKLAGHRLLRLGSASLSAAPGRAPRIRTRRYAAADGVAASSTTTTTTTTTTTAAASGGENGEGGPLGKAFFSSLCLLTFGLGTWQTRRYFEKLEMVKKREDDLGMDPLPNFDMWRTTRGNDDDEDAAVDMKTKTKTKIADVPRSYRRVRLRGEFQHANEMLIGPRGPPPGALAESGPNSGRGGGGGMSSSAQGYLVVTPFVISDDDDDDDDDNDDDDAVRRRRTTTGIRGEEGGAGRIIRGWFGRLQRGEEAGESYDSKSKAVRSPSSIDANDVGTVVWINRGWIPRHYVNNRYEIVTSWERPRGTVTLTAMESNTETGGTFAPPSRLEGGRRGNGGDDRRPTPECKRLLWMDRRAMEELTSCGADRHPYLFVEIDAVERKGAPPSFPAKASREFVGEFKVSPGVHAGYAFTWFGLSSAGIVMTRKLLSRGR